MDGQLDINDIDLLSNEIRQEMRNTRFDVDGSSTVDREDLSFIVLSALETWHGDANLDGEFNSGDLVAVFSAGE